MNDIQRRIERIFIWLALFFGFYALSVATVIFVQNHRLVQTDRELQANRKVLRSLMQDLRDLNNRADNALAVMQLVEHYEREMQQLQAEFKPKEVHVEETR